MRVMHLMAGARHGGAEAFFDRLVPALARAGLEQRVVVRGWPERLANLRAAGVEAIPARFGGPLDPRTPLILRRAVQTCEPHVVLSWMSRAARACPRGPFVHAARLGGYYKLKAYRRCHHLVANTPDIRRYLLAGGWPAERVHYLPNFVHSEAAAPVARHALATPEDAPVLLALGRLHPNKAFDTLLNALARLPGAWLWLAGDGPGREALEALAHGLGVAERVRFLGWREDTAVLMAAADLAVVSARHEPLGNVVLEAWAQRLPVVACASEGPGALIDDNATGLLAPVDDADALAGAVRRALDDGALRARLAEAGHAAWAEGYTEAAVVRRYLEFFREVST